LDADDSGSFAEFELAIQVGRAMGGALDGRPTALRNASTAEGAVRAAMIFIRPAQLGHTVTSYWKTLAKSLAQETRWSRSGEAGASTPW
jgi:hypothetical protein